MELSRRDFLKIFAGATAAAALPVGAIASTTATLEPARSFGLWYENKVLGEHVHRIAIPLPDDVNANDPEIHNLVATMCAAGAIIVSDGIMPGVYRMNGTSEEVANMLEADMDRIQKLPITDWKILPRKA